MTRGKLIATGLMVLFARDAWAQCAKDTDCKGDRICIDGKCVDPPAAAAPDRTAWKAAAPANGRPGDRFDIDCPPGGAGASVWGDGHYTADSSVCTAAVHAGLINFQSGGRVAILIQGGRSSFSGINRNGVRTQPYIDYPKTFIFPNAPGAPAPMTSAVGRTRAGSPAFSVWLGIRWIRIRPTSSFVSESTGTGLGFGLMGGIHVSQPVALGLYIQMNEGMNEGKVTSSQVRYTAGERHIHLAVRYRQWGRGALVMQSTVRAGYGQLYTKSGRFSEASSSFSGGTDIELIVSRMITIGVYFNAAVYDNVAFYDNFDDSYPSSALVNSMAVGIGFIY